jgi:hypothetical protein
LNDDVGIVENETLFEGFFLVAPILWVLVYTDTFARYRYKALWLLPGATFVCQPYWAWLYFDVGLCCIRGECG